MDKFSVFEFARCKYGLTANDVWLKSLGCICILFAVECLAYLQVDAAQAVSYSVPQRCLTLFLIFSSFWFNAAQEQKEPVVRIPFVSASAQLLGRRINSNEWRVNLYCLSLSLCHCPIVSNCLDLSPHFLSRSFSLHDRFLQGRSWRHVSCHKGRRGGVQERGA